MIEITNLLKLYNGKTAVDIPDLVINGGELLGVVGNNGAGKTTLFRLMLDLVRADAGEVKLNSIPVAASEEWKAFTAAYLDEGFLIGFLTPKEYLYFIGKLYNSLQPDVDEFLSGFDSFINSVELNSGKYIRDLSRGNQFKVGIISALLQNPSILILDEPFANLDPSSQFQLKQMLNDLNTEKKVTILVSSHDLDQVTGLCNRILLLEKGKVISDLETNAETLDNLRSYFQQGQK